MLTLYVLRLTNDKYYVGVTNDVQKRFEQHKSGDGSAWTKMYKPLSVIETRPVTTEYDEENVTKQYMTTYGIKHVRGGPYCQMILTDAQVTALEQSIWHSKNACLRCGRTSHYADKCYAKTTVDGRKLVDKPKVESPDIFENMAPGPVTLKVETNGRMVDVYDSSHSEYVGPSIVPGGFEDRVEIKGDACYRCGRIGHWSHECYARTHIDGRALRARTRDNTTVNRPIDLSQCCTIL